MGENRGIGGGGLSISNISAGALSAMNLIGVMSGMSLNGGNMVPQSTVQPQQASPVPPPSGTTDQFAGLF